MNTPVRDGEHLLEAKERKKYDPTILLYQVPTSIFKCHVEAVGGFSSREDDRDVEK
jgi:hypothetical protein